MSMLKVLVLGILLGSALLLSNGIYEFAAPTPDTVNRYNRFTGTIEFCAPQIGCKVVAEGVELAPLD